MKKLLVVLMFFSAAALAAQKDIAKSGWNLGLLPVVAYNTDLGFEYGLILNFFNYGDGSRYPNYNHKIYLEASQYTKGSGIYRFYYDSDRLIPGIRLLTDVSWLPDRAYDFLGFNGYESVYNREWEDQEASTYKTRMFYKYDRDFLRVKMDLQGKVRGARLRWAAGFTARKFTISSVDVDKLNEGKSEEDMLPPVSEQPGLYEKYVDWGVIPDAEKNGGFIASIKAGVVYDSRDVIANPGRGVWTEATLIASPKALGSDFYFVKLNLTHRQYFTIFPHALTFAYRLGCQQTISGKTPFFYLPIIEPSEMAAAKSEGLGGDRFNRGIRRNRIIGEGVLYGNFEFRWKFWRFHIANQNFYIGTNIFVDMGLVTDKVDMNVEDSDIEDVSSYFNPGAEKMHYSTGLGLKIAMNENFIVSIDYGRALNEQDGKSGLYILLNYLF